MTKNVFIIFVLVLFLGVAIWFFYQKTKNSDEVKDFSSLLEKNDPKSSMTPTPEINPTTSIKLPNGLEIQDIQIGVGLEARSGNIVFAHYKGTLQDGTVFDESYTRGQPFAFILGAGQVIKGWDLGLVGMKVGGKRRLVIPPDLGYGSRGQGPIPANSTLIFEIELIDVQTEPQ